MYKLDIPYELKIKRLRAFYEKHKDEPSQAGKSCPFPFEYGKVTCYNLCLYFERFHNEEHRCPCNAFGYEEAMTRLKVVIDEAEWENYHDYEQYE